MRVFMRVFAVAAILLATTSVAFGEVSEVDKDKISTALSVQRTLVDYGDALQPIFVTDVDGYNTLRALFQAWTDGLEAINRYKPVEIDEAFTEEMDYFNTGDFTNSDFYKDSTIFLSYFKRVSKLYYTRRAEEDWK